MADLTWLKSYDMMVESFTEFKSISYKSNESHTHTHAPTIHIGMEKNLSKGPKAW